MCIRSPYGARCVILMRRNNIQMWRTSSMGHLHGRFILVHILTYCVISGEVISFITFDVRIF